MAIFILSVSHACLFVLLFLRVSYIYNYNNYINICIYKKIYIYNYIYMFI